MADLSVLERQKLEKFLGMETGYVLDFTNRTFQEFVHESTGRDIYNERYNLGSGSKANRLRAFWKLEDNRVVGKLLTDLLDYSEDTGAKSEVCRLIAGRLSHRANDEKAHGAPKPQAQADHLVTRSQTLRSLKEDFEKLSSESDRAKAGLALERLLNHLFALFSLQPRQPFRVVGEQIDGSFVLDGQVYLMESKWEKAPLPEADLLIFRGKIEGKSTFTRGVLIALNDVSHQAREAITRGKAPSFFVMNGYDILMVLNEVVNLDEFLRRRVRLLAEEGRVCVPFGDTTR